MSVTVAQLMVVVQANTAPLQQAVTQVTASVATAQAAAQRMGDALGAYFDRLQTKLSNLGDGLTSLGKKMSIGLTLPLLAAGKAMLDAASKMDTWQRGLTAVMGSSKAAGDELKRLEQTAKLPGLTLDTLVQGSLRLQNAGQSAQQARQELSAFGNALALLGRNATAMTTVQNSLVRLAEAGTNVGGMLRGLERQVPQVHDILIKAFGTDTAKGLKALGVTGQQALDTITQGLAKLPSAGYSTATAIKNLGLSFQLLEASVGKAIATVAVPLMTKLSSVLDDLTSRFQNLSPATQDLIVKIGAIVAAAGPVLLILGKLATAAGAIGEFFGAAGLGGAIVALLPEIAALAAIAGVLYVAWKENLGGVRDYVSKVFADIIAFFDQQISVVRQWVIDNKALILETWAAIKVGIAKLMKDIEIIFDAAWGMIKATLRVALDTILSAMKLAMQIAKGDWKAAWDTFASWVSRTWDNIQIFVLRGVNGVLKLLQGMSQSISAAFGGDNQTAFDGSIKLYGDRIDELETKVKNANKTVGPGLESLASSFKKAFASTGGSKTPGEDEASTTARGLQAVGDAAKGAKEKLTPYQKAVQAANEYMKSLSESIRDVNETTTVQQALHKINAGALQLVSQATKNHILALAAQLDKVKATKKALDDYKSTLQKANETITAARDPEAAMVQVLGYELSAWHALDTAHKNVLRSKYLVIKADQDAKAAMDAHTESVKELNQSFADEMSSMQIAIAMIGKKTNVEKASVEISIGKYKDYDNIMQACILATAAIEDATEQEADALEKVNKAQDDLYGSALSQISAYQKQIDLFGKTTEAEKMYYEVTKGMYKDLDDDTANYLMDLADQIDLMNANKDAADALAKSQADQLKRYNDYMEGVTRQLERLHAKTDQVKLQQDLMAEGFTEQEARAAAAYKTYADQVDAAQKKMAQFNSDIADLFTDNLLKIGQGWHTFFQGIMSGFQDLLAKMAMEILKSQMLKLLTGLIGNSLGGFFGMPSSVAGSSASSSIGGASGLAGVGSGGFGGSLGGSLGLGAGTGLGGGNIQFNAAGGRYVSGMARMTSELGPEIDIPDHAGTVLSSNFLVKLDNMASQFADINSRSPSGTRGGAAGSPIISSGADGGTTVNFSPTYNITTDNPDEFRKSQRATLLEGKSTIDEVYRRTGR